MAPGPRQTHCHSLRQPLERPIRRLLPPQERSRQWIRKTSTRRYGCLAANPPCYGYVRCGCQNRWNYCHSRRACWSGRLLWPASCDVVAVVPLGLPARAASNSCHLSSQLHVQTAHTDLASQNDCRRNLPQRLQTLRKVNVAGYLETLPFHMRWQIGPLVFPSGDNEKNNLILLPRRSGGCRCVW